MVVKKVKIRKKTLLKLSCAFFVLVVSLIIIHMASSTAVVNNIEGVWDGVEIATSFSGGNGTKENPYQISKGSELAYLKQIVEQNIFPDLKDKYFILTADIDLGENNWQGIGTKTETEEFAFSGHLDGQGYSISNMKISQPSTLNTNDYYGFFNIVSDAEIKNINFVNVNITTTASENPVTIGLIAGEVKGTSSISNIAIQTSSIDLTQTYTKPDDRIGGVFGEVSASSTIEKIYNNIQITDVNATSFGNIFGILNGNAKTILTQVTYTNFLSVNVTEAKTLGETATIEESYKLVANPNDNNKLYIENSSEETMESLLEKLNTPENEAFSWQEENGMLKIARPVEEEIIIQETPVMPPPETEVPKNFNFGRSAAIVLHETGITDTTVYINDLDSDYNYYQGLNYTEKSDGTLPSGQNQGLYNDTNLVKVYVKYSGVDINDSSLVGHVSLDEQQSEFIYYKYYPTENGYVTFDLIDNPFADHPDNKAFNGWVTDYPGATISYDADTYTRRVTVPVTSDIVNITFQSSWIDATVYQMTSTNWNTAFNSLNDAGMHRLDVVRGIYEDVSDYYISQTISRGERYPSGAVNNRLQSQTGTCSGWGVQTCTYYIQSPSSEYNEEYTYYRVNGNRLVEYMPQQTGEETILPDDTIMGAYYKQVSISRGGSIAGYYNDQGEYQSSGTCTSTSCIYYELQQYYDADGNVNVLDKDSSYYYLVTRDTNIIVLRTNVDSAWSGDKPFTLTGIYNGNDYSDSRINLEAGGWFGGGTYLTMHADTRIEYITLNGDTRKESDTEPASSNNTGSTIYGAWYNLKIGRGITTSDGSNYTTADSIMAGNNGSTGSSSNITRYKLEIESGVYNTTSAVGGRSAGTLYIDGQVIYGSDYDRIANNNDNLEVYFCASGSWGGTIYSTSTQTGIALHTTVKSGSFGTSEYDYSSGIYVGGRSGGTHYAAREAIIEGGDIYNLIGGPLTASNRTNINDTYINIKGGTIDMVIGGAGASETYGNRIINMTGGTVNYGVFGGSNGYTGGDNDSNYKGTLSGSTFVYIGGTSTVGNDTLINNEDELFGVSSGNVFGIGNGNSSSTQVGSADNSNIVIDGNAVIKQSVYGGGNYGATGLVPYQNQNGSKDSTTKIRVLGGTVQGSVYGGGNNNGSGGTATYRSGGSWGGGTTYTTTVTSTINIEVLGGTINNSVYGGSRVKGTVYGDTNVSVLAGNIIKNVYGGGEGGYRNSNNPGTYIEENVNVIIGSETSYPTINGSVYGGSAYGTVNGTGENESANSSTTNVTVNNAVIDQSVFGGGKGSDEYTPKVYGNVTVTINNGNIGNVFGGNDAAGSPSNNDIVYLNGGIIGNAFGGGNETGQTNTNIYLQGATVTKLFGGSNQSGTVSESNVYMNSGTADYVYGGNNSGGTTQSTNVTINGGTVNQDVYGGGSLADSNSTRLQLGYATLNNVYAGGEQASATTTQTTVRGATIQNLFGGSNIDGTVNRASIQMTNGTIGNIYGGNNLGGSSSDATVMVDNGQIGTIYGGGNRASSETSTILINRGTIDNIFGGGNEAGLETATININRGTIGNIYGGSNQSGDIDTTYITVQYSTSTTVDNIFGGNNMGGVTTNSNVYVYGGTTGNVYGGGNEAEVTNPMVQVQNATVNNVFGGGNMAKITTNTSVTITNSTILTNVYGGGNEGEVSGNTEVKITSSNINGSAYAGGNGATAIVHQNTSITVEGDSVIGTETSTAPHAGCVFGGGNAAATGTEANNNSLATVNIVGGKIYGNVYGGANTSVVYGKTDTNIGTNAVEQTNLTEASINIGGTVFGGGEANAAGDENYDFSFISVTGAIDIDIDGLSYLDNDHEFILQGSIFGSGNASSSSGTSEIYIANLGTRDNPSRNISIQRANTVILDNTVMELEGTTDRTNEYSDIEYSLNRIDELNIKNNTMLLLQRNANLLQSFKSTVDVDGQEQKATVIINDDTKNVTKNVDNRLYMLANRNLNITTNEAATEYGQVSGMTFFGMYQTYENGSISYGLYEDSVNYGDAGDAGDIIIGGSYVLGLHNLNHDITVDGFYSNYIDDSYTEISTAYIEPTPPDSNYYMWTIGISAVNYSFAMTASKYSSLGTYELSMREFAKGNTTFEVIGFNSEGLTSGVELIDSASVPKIAETEEEANSILGLSMKSETSEWTSYETTKFLSQNDGTFTGDDTYITDSQALAPSLMFYLYHAKNITLDQELGTVVVTMQAKTPINEIEYDVQLITITIDIVARSYDDGNAYDASITYDKKYEMPAATSVNITNQSQFTAYFDLFATSEKFEDIYGINNKNYHALVTDYALPVGTQITMLDLGNQNGTPSYYYYTVDENSYNQALTQLQNENEVTYRLSDFIKMGSTSADNTYDDQKMNLIYYNDNQKTTMEEFIFIFDFKETTTTGDHLNHYMRFELRNEEDRAVISVLGIRQNIMYYNLYESSNVVLNQTVTLDNNYIYPDMESHINYKTAVTYDQTGNRESIINTNYESTSMGLNITLYDSEGKQISASYLTGTSIRMDGVDYFADSEGVFRIKLAGKVSNLEKNLYFLTDESLPTGNYKMVFSLFASSDGLHNTGGLQAVEDTFDVTVVPSDNAIKATSEDKTKIIDGQTALNENQTNETTFKIETLENLTSPNLRVALYKRNTDNKDTMTYTEVSLDQVFNHTFSDPAVFGYTPSTPNELLVSTNVSNNSDVTLSYKDTLTSGTYRIIFRLFDNNQLIDEDWEYFIIKKEDVT